MKAKSGSLSTKLIMVFVALAVAAYFGIQGYRYLVEADAIVPVYAYSAEDVIELSGYVVRDETVVPCGETLLELSRAEGERVAYGKPLATVYASESALRSAQELASLREQLAQLEYARSAARDAETALRLDADIEDGITALRASLARRGYASLEAEASALKTAVLKREFAYRGSTDLTARIEALSARIDSLSATVGGAARTIRAPFAGTYSAVVDGYESVLTPELLETLTPAELDAAAPTAERSTVGKLIRGDAWYFAAAVPEREARLLTEGRALTLRTASGVDFDLPVTVERISAARDGRCAVVLSSREYLSYVTLLRAQNAELILRTYEGLRIPNNALRIDADGRTGVYCRVGRVAYFKPVELLYQGEDYCLVVPGEINAPTESQRMLYTLRAGDEAIISPEDLFNGKVVD